MQFQTGRIKKYLKTIIKIEQSIQILRQLLCQQIDFNIQSTFYIISSNQNKFGLSHIKKFIASPQLQNKVQISDKIIQRMIKFYSNGNLQLTINEWKNIILSREDNLISKLANQRNISLKQPPLFIINYCKKILIKQYQLHSNIELFLNQKPFLDLSKILINNINQNGNIESISQIKSNQFNHHQISILIRYINQGYQEYQNLRFNIKLLFNNYNSKKIQNFLEKKQIQFQKNNQNSNFYNPYIHKKFRDLMKQNKDNNPQPSFIRHAKSIQLHLNRSKNMPSNSQILKKIQLFTSSLQNQIKIFFKSLNKILKINTQIINQKKRLIQNNNWNFILLFSQICKNKEMIPSQLQHFFHKLGIDISLPPLFLLFKRYCDPITGKINKKQFNRIFKISGNINKNKKCGYLDKQFLNQAALCLIAQLSYQQKIQQQKISLMKKINLREIFDAIDTDNDRYLSITDLQVIYKKIGNKKFKLNYLTQLWQRMNRVHTQLVDYDTFMYELIPRIKHRQIYKN